MPFASALSPVLDLVYPPRCPLCGAALAAQDGLCGPCWSTLVIPADPACGSCGKPLPQAARDAANCAACLADPPAHDGVVAATVYNDASRRLVLSFKHGNRIALGSMLARLMAARLGDVDDSWIAVPVPLHRWRLWRRGYNQAALLAGAIARQKGARLCVDALERRKATPMLGGLGASARRQALAGAISANPRRQRVLAGARIVLVDDVMTSGATSDACVAALKGAGATTVRIACFSRVLEGARDAGRGL